MNDNTPAPVLTRAILLWKAGRRITLTLFAELAAEGYDVPALERFYMRK